MVMLPSGPIGVPPIDAVPIITPSDYSQNGGVGQNGADQNGAEPNGGTSPGGTEDPGALLTGGADGALAPLAVEDAYEAVVGQASRSSLPLPWSPRHLMARGPCSSASGWASQLSSPWAPCICVSASRSRVPPSTGAAM
ncbi:MAG: hypothetical protein R2717_01125 [Schumannella sp.]